MKSQRMNQLRFMVATIGLVIFACNLAQAQTYTIVADIEEVSPYPCITQPGWFEWHMGIKARLRKIFQGEGQEQVLTATVGWYVKYYGSNNFQYVGSSQTGQLWESDGHRCPGDSVHYSWEQIWRADMSYGGQVYSAYYTAGGTAAATYPCCWNNCHPPNPPPCQ